MGVLVTGGAGYIGSHMAWSLCDQGEPVVILDRLSTGFAAAVPPAAVLIKGDCGDRRLLSALIAEHSIDAILHFAGSVVVPESVAHPLEYYENNTIKSHALIQTAIEAGVRTFVFSSTAAVYGSVGGAPIDELAPTRPESPYGASKLMTEWMLRDAAAAHGLNYCVLRYFNVAGADPQLRTGQATRGATHLIKVAVETALGKRPSLSVFGTDYPTQDGTCVRDYIHVWDLIEAHVLALRYLRADGAPATLNCGYGRGFSVREVIEAVRRASGRSIDVIEAPRRPGDPAMIVANARRARELLGWSPKFDDLDRIVTDAFAWENSARFREITAA